MRVLQIVKTNRGASWAFRQARCLKDLGVEIITMLPDSDAGYAVRYAEEDMEVIAGDWSLPVLKPWRIPAKAREIRNTVSEIHPDLIHFHFVTNILMGRIALRRDKTKRLFQVPGPLHLENVITRSVECGLATESDYWAGSCKKTCDYYLESGIDPERVFLAYYGGEFDSEVVESDSRLHSEYDLPDDAVVIAMVSYFYKPKRYLGQKRGLKGHEDFIDAIDIVLKTHPEVVPMIIGNAWDGSERYEQKVKQYAHDKLRGKVIFTGFRDDIKHLYSEIDIAVHPSHSENLGGAGESLSMKVPTVATNIGGFPDIVIAGKTGLLVRPKDPEDLAEKIIWMIEHNDEAKQMGENGKKLVEELLDVKATARQVLWVYKRVLGKER